MNWQLVRGPSGKVCFELDAARGLIRIRHNRTCTDIVDLREFGLVLRQEGGAVAPEAARLFRPAIDFSAKT